MADDMCPDCGHGWERHGPEVPGCCECRCLLVLTSGRRRRTAALAPPARPDAAVVAGGEVGG